MYKNILIRKLMLISKFMKPHLGSKQLQDIYGPISQEINAFGR